MTSGRSRCSTERIGEDPARSRRTGILENLIWSTALRIVSTSNYDNDNVGG